MLSLSRSDAAPRLQVPPRRSGRVAQSSGRLRAWRQAGVILAAAGAATLLLGVAGALDPLFARFDRDDAVPRTPTGFPGEWASVADSAVRANTTTIGVDRVWAPHWDREGGYLRPIVPYAYFQPEPQLRAALARGDAGALVVSLTVRDADRDWHSFGSVNEPGEAKDLRMLHAWRGMGEGGWRTEVVQVPAGVRIDGWLYLSIGVSAAEIRVEAAPG